MSFNSLKGGASFPINRAGSGRDVHYSFGSVSISAGATFLYPANAPTTAASGGTIAVAGQHTAVYKGILNRFFVRHSNPSVAQTMTYTLFVNGLATAIVLVLSSGGTLVFDIVNTLAVNSGDALLVQVTNSGGILGLRTVWEMVLTRTN
jgi:hypothetical protein